MGPVQRRALRKWVAWAVRGQSLRCMWGLRLTGAAASESRALGGGGFSGDLARPPPRSFAAKERAQWQSANTALAG
eukprot:119422-Pyramimonas_sp.AAC.1